MLTSSTVESISGPATGANVTLDENGYIIIEGQCCNWEMQEFIRRVINHNGLKICDESALRGFVPWYSCTYGPRSLAVMEAELLDVMDSDCPWVVRVQDTCHPLPDTCHHPAGNISWDCGCSRSESFEIDFFGSTVTQNNLAGWGPDTGAQEIRYTNVGTYTSAGGDSVVVDLAVTGNSSYDTSNNKSNGKSGKFGTINLRGGNSVELTFSFMRTGTNVPIELGEVFISFFDLDQSYSDKMLERIYTSGYHAFVIEKSAEIDMMIERAPDGRTIFMSKVHGTGCDNPKDPLQLGPITCTYRDGVNTIDQRKRSFMLAFQKVQSFKVSLLTTCVDPVTGAADCAKGRNFLFAGKSSLQDRCAD